MDVHTRTIRGHSLDIAADFWSSVRCDIAQSCLQADVLLVPGGGQTRHSWRSTAQALVDNRFKAVTMDLRGHGASGWSANGDYTVDDFAADITQVAGELGAPVLVGASVGGLACMLAQSCHAELARALVLLDVTPRLEPAGLDQVAAFMRLGAEGFSSLLKAADAFTSHGRPRPNIEKLRKTMRYRNGRWYWHWDPRVFNHVNTDRTHSDDRQQRLLDAASRISIPTAIFRGENSTIVSDAGVNELVNVMPNAEARTLTGVGHMLAGEDNAAFNTTLLEFLTSLSRRSV